ncbi:MAG: AraC family transcriptional regulator [Nevskiales bacterium]|nr:AraC family transcriptional regulator [Nevskiales bacterium]
MPRTDSIEKDSVSISFVVEAIAGVRARGRDPAGLLDQAGIPVALLGSAQSRVAAERFSALWLAVAAALDDEFFGLDARRMKVGSFATLCHLMIGARTLRDALKRAARLFGIVLDDTEVVPDFGGAAAALALQPTARARAAGRELKPFAHETLLIMLHGLACWIIGRRIPLSQAQFAYPRPARWREYTVMYAQRLVFDCPMTRIEFDPQFLDAPVVQDEASAREFLREAPYTIVLKYKDTNSLTAQVRQYLRDAAPQDWPGFDALAQTLELSPSVLRRGLEREGTTFRAIKDDLRRDLAIGHLTDTDLPIPEIAAELGFAEPSAFHRAFKQWTGVRPGEYRRSQAGGG